MDASASTKPDAENSKVFNFYLNIHDVDPTPPPKQKSSVIKYTKLPDFDFDSKATWGPNSYTLKPRLRRIIAIDEDELLRTGRSMKTHPAATPRMLATSHNNPKRKIVTISEEDDNIDLHPKFSTEKKPFTERTISKTTEFKPTQNRLTSRNPSKFSKEINTSAKTKSPTSKKEMIVSVSQHPRRGRPTNPTDNNKIISRNEKEKETLNPRNPKTLKSSIKTRELSKALMITSENERELTKIKNIMYENVTKSKPNSKPVEKSSQKLPQLHNKSPKVTFKDMSSKPKPLSVIHVPFAARPKKKEKVLSALPEEESVVYTIDCTSETDDMVHYKDAVVATDPLPTSISSITEMHDFAINTITHTTCESTCQTDSKNTKYDSLEIPNVTLTKDKSEPKEDRRIIKTTSLPNLKVPPIKIIPQSEEVNSSDISFCQGASYIFSRATVTYTTRQKINFQIVGKDEVGPSEPPSPLDYPMSVVSLFKHELKNKKTNKNDTLDDSSKKKITPREDYLNHLNDMKTLNCSYVFNKLMKPSDIISTIRVNNGLVQNEYICEQFQRELNFIDSFFESLQYLENCSLTDKCITESKHQNFTNKPVLFNSTFDAKNTEYDNFLSKLENGANVDDTETMASKSLSLLNLLIRDEQRRARNLLFVLKMREDALKDFTKSQILWLEKKKKHDNTDISTLKKKQRGALLKLQHECGEMQRMRKALLTLSEKRKEALMKTKKNIELKVNNNVDVDQIILGKKKLKRSSCLDRNSSPLKCFDLSSSGCEESSTSKAASEASPLKADECAAGIPRATVVSGAAGTTGAASTTGAAGAIGAAGATGRVGAEGAAAVACVVGVEDSARTADVACLARTADVACMASTADVACMASTTDLSCMPGTAGVASVAGTADVACMASAAEVVCMARTADVACMASTADLACMAGTTDVATVAGAADEACIASVAELACAARAADVGCVAGAAHVEGLAGATSVEGMAGAAGAVGAATAAGAVGAATAAGAVGAATAAGAVVAASESGAALALSGVSSAEKCVQTSGVQPAIDHGTDTAAEHFVVVDGGYLNILFHNLALPQIFSSGKQYEVNEEALRNIVNSANSHNTNLSGSEVVEKLMNQIKNKDVEKTEKSCSPPSTARSLIEEFDQYYKDLREEDKSHTTTSELESDQSGKISEDKELSVKTGEVEFEQQEEQSSQTSPSTLTSSGSDGGGRVSEWSAGASEPCPCKEAAPPPPPSSASSDPRDKEPAAATHLVAAPNGPLPVPVGAAAVLDNPPPDVPAWFPSKSSSSSYTETTSVSSQSMCGSVSSLASLSAPVQVEAEELRRQQLAIEREIKALEQQQCRLLVVREIPDKPPPPYTPPTEKRTAKPPRMFTPDENLQNKVKKHIIDLKGASCDSTEAFSVFVRDYCQESLARHKQEQSDKPWDACNLLPQKRPVGTHELVVNTSAELKDVLTTVTTRTAAAVPGVSSRRSDHIDDILFAEWRRCEPEWTALHTDEAIVKNQIFESIFQKILNSTIDEYKKTVQCTLVPSD